MPRLSHETLVQLVRHAPSLIPDLLWPGERSPSPIRVTAAEFVDLERARELPELAVLSVAAHADEPGAEQIAFAALEATRDLDDPRGILYPDFVLALLGRVARAALEKLLMVNGRWEPQSDLFRKPWLEGIAEGEAKGRAQGKAEGKAEVVLKLLQLKGFAPSDEQRRRVLDCRDEAQLETWAGRVLVATRLDEVFAD